MSSVEERTRDCGGQANLMHDMKLLKEVQNKTGNRKSLNSELWYACAGPLVSLPQVGSLAYYFPQGHSEQVAVSTKRTATLQIPNYPNLPSELLCQVHNLTLHADKETDEVYAQMSLQPVNSENDAYPTPDFGLKPYKHPSVFFCKTLTASDTSTHGGFSVPRRAAEKLFPPLDYSVQPPTQELIVKDLHENTWSFRHIYRGQPKRHLLTTGWSLFVSSKRLKSGDAVLFIRDEKSQLLVGVRRANRQQTTLPSSVLSADSMHIGVLAAAAHAAANYSPFTIFYNPRACPSDFIIPSARYRKAVYGTQVSIGMRFGMMFETEESGKRRYMGTIVGISDTDPLRWPGSKWRNLQVEWDEQGCSDKQNRVSSWEIETPESMFIFSSLTSAIKRPFHPSFAGGGTESGSLMKKPMAWLPENSNGTYSQYPDVMFNMLLKSQVGDHAAVRSSSSQESPLAAKGTISQTHLLPQSGAVCDAAEQYFNGGFASEKLCPQSKAENQIWVEINAAKSKSELHHLSSELSQLTQVEVQHGLWPVQPRAEPPLLQSQQVAQLDPTFMKENLNFLDNNQLGLHFSSSSLSGLYKPSSPCPLLGLQDTSLLLYDAMSPFLPLANEEYAGSAPRVCSQANELVPFSLKDQRGLNSSGVKDWSDESNDQSGIYGSLNFDARNDGTNVIDHSVSSCVLDEFCSSKGVESQNPSDCFIPNFNSNQDAQSQVTCVSLVESHGFSLQEVPDTSGGTSSSNVDFDRRNLLQNNLWHPAASRMRTYTKVQRAGSVGRSIDVSNFKNYEELCSAIECMFGLEGLLNNPTHSGWKLVYVDYENDVLLIGDDPWEEFVCCVRCIRILSPTEVQQMSEEGMKLLHSAHNQSVSAAIA